MHQIRETTWVAAKTRDRAGNIIGSTTRVKKIAKLNITWRELP
uniref:Uncharacterized protein n=1 Tax=Setaria italica TaxID=4555 RepID=K3XTL0_SETIT